MYDSLDKNHICNIENNNDVVQLKCDAIISLYTLDKITIMHWSLSVNAEIMYVATEYVYMNKKCNQSK